jgi:hypothetical protein
MRARSVVVYPTLVFALVCSTGCDPTAPPAVVIPEQAAAWWGTLRTVTPDGERYEVAVCPEQHEFEGGTELLLLPMEDAPQLVLELDLAGGLLHPALWAGERLRFRSLGSPGSSLLSLDGWSDTESTLRVRARLTSLLGGGDGELEPEIEEVELELRSGPFGESRMLYATTRAADGRRVEAAILVNENPGPNGEGAD